jgi:hypothetical protein
MASVFPLSCKKFEMKRFCFWIVVIITTGTLSGQPRTDTLLQNILLASESEIVRHVIADPDTFRLQIIYTQINRDIHNVPSFHNYYFNFKDDMYFYPASTVKLPLALLALEKINKMGRKDVTKFTSLQFDSSFAWQVPSTYDSTSESNLPSIAHYIRKAFLVSDNDAYNRMYQFVGQGSINNTLQSKGYRHTLILRQFMGLTEEQNRYTNQVRFLDKSGKVFYTQEPQYNREYLQDAGSVKVGKTYLNRNDSMVNAPMDFTRANRIGLVDLQQMLQSVMFPESVPLHQQFLLTKSDRDFLYQFLSQYPSETNYPKYDTSQYYDSYVKFFFRHGSHRMPAHVRVFNKSGWAYGFLTDVSYVADFKNHVEFMLTATIYTNSDGVLNDDRYDYEKVGWPFLYDLGQAIYQYELSREHKVKPDLSPFRAKYEKRDPRDTRKSLRDVDN